MAKKKENKNEFGKKILFVLLKVLIICLMISIVLWYSVGNLEEIIPALEKISELLISGETTKFKVIIYIFPIIFLIFGLLEFGLFFIDYKKNK